MNEGQAMPMSPPTTPLDIVKAIILVMSVYVFWWVLRITSELAGFEYT